MYLYCFDIYISLLHLKWPWQMSKHFSYIVWLWHGMFLNLYFNNILIFLRRPSALGFLFYFTPENVFFKRKEYVSNTFWKFFIITFKQQTKVLFYIYISKCSPRQDSMHWCKSVYYLYNGSPKTDVIYLYNLLQYYYY